MILGWYWGEVGKGVVLGSNWDGIGGWGIWGVYYSFILRLSRDTGALILTNDLYKEYRDEFDWIDKKRVPYSIINGELYLHPIYDDDK